jgi:hypothetical protein
MRAGCFNIPNAYTGRTCTGHVIIDFNAYSRREYDVDIMSLRQP